MIALVAQFLRHPAPRTRIAGRRLAERCRSGRRQFTTAEMLRTPQFYLLYVMFVLMATGGLLVTANAGPMARRGDSRPPR